MKYIKTLIRGFLAGIAISLGGIVYLKTNVITGSIVLGAFLFTMGLIIICNFKLYLYSGKICYLFDQCEEKYSQKLLTLFLGLIGNFLGTLFCGLLFRLCFDNEELLNYVNTLVNNKINLAWYKTLILAFFCGILVYIAVEVFKKIESNLGKYVVLILAISGFILAGFEHCIANMFYYAFNLSFSLDAVLSILLCILGNSLGGIFAQEINKFINK